MRKQFLYRSIWMVYPLLLWACTKEESADASSNLSLYGEKFKVGDQVIWHDDDYVAKEFKDYIFIDRYQNSLGQNVEDTVKAFMTEEKGYLTGNFILSLYGDGIKVNETLKDAAGQGACICLHLASADQNKLLPGKYVYKMGGDKNTFIGYSTSYYSNTEESYPVNPIISGEVNIEINGDQYVVRLTGKNQNGGSVSCDYSGVVPVIDIKKGNNILAFTNNVNLSALYDDPSSSTPDMYTDAFTIAGGGSIYSGSSIGLWIKDAEARNNIDVALLEKKGEPKVFFMSPVKMRASLWHNTYLDYKNVLLDFNLYGHTTYMNAPADFTVASFDALGIEDFNFSVQEQEVGLSYPLTEPHFVFFQNGKGERGIIKVKSIAKPTWKGARAVLIMDIKMVRNFSFLIK